MAYTRAWERLSDALTRIMDAGGLAENEAQADICRAIADEAVRIRAKLGMRTPGGTTARDTVLEGERFHIPPFLKPEDLDWRESRPLKPWLVQRGAFRPHGRWSLEWIELFRTDVTDELCRPTEGGEPANAPSKVGPRSRSRPTLERVRHAIEILYPDGVPKQSVEPNANLYRRIGKWLKDKGLPDVSNDTILRAAGRRK